MRWDEEVGGEEKWVEVLYDQTFADNSVGVLRGGRKMYVVFYHGQSAHNADLTDQNRANRKLSATSGNSTISSLINPTWR